MLLSLPLLCAMRGRCVAAARIAGFAGAMQTRLGENASNLAPMLRERLEPLLAGLGSEERLRMAAEGATMRDEDVFRLAFDETGRDRAVAAKTSA